MSTRILISLILALLTGCASKSLPSNYTLNPNGTKGVVVASITYNGSFGVHRINIKSLDGAVREYLAVGQSSLLPMPKNYDIKEPSATGDVFSLELPQGSYEVSSWSVDSYSNHLEAPTNIRFTVEAGKITYLGRFEFQQLDTNGVIVTKVALSVKDNSAKDIAIVSARTPAISSEQALINTSTSDAAKNINKTTPASEYAPPLIFMKPIK